MIERKRGNVKTRILEIEDEIVELLKQSGRPPGVVAREVIVMDLYRRGSISGDTASELLCMPRLTFIERASQLGPHFRFTDEEVSGRDQE